MEPTFEWDETKARQNLRKHNISFEEAATVFGDPMSVTVPDPRHSDKEDRYVVIGCSANQQTLVVVYTMRGRNIRVISCRKATRSERKAYEKGKN